MNLLVFAHRLAFEILEVFLVATTLCTLNVLCQSIEDEFNNECTMAKTCSECIQTSPLCAWCAAEDYPRDLPRCDVMSKILSLRQCDDADIMNPKFNFQVLRNDDWTSGDGKYDNQPPIQIKPQRVEFVLRPNEPKSFKLHFQKQANYPVDLYFLLDLSYGMFRQKAAQERLIALGNDITQSMANDITDNFRLGFGTFVDKVLMPYTPWTDRMLQDRCPLKGKQCRYPFAFKNQLSIGLNQSSFASSMKNALEYVSQSNDDAEAGLDGLIQALGCDVIGWRGTSQRIIVYSSNSLFHLAGAGKLGGATKQNMLTCNLTADGSYAGGKIYDYPSVSQVAAKVRDSRANVIFAVMNNVAQYYSALASFLGGTGVVGELEDDSKNIVDLIKEKYFELRSRIKFQPPETEGVEVKFMSKCNGTKMMETAECTNLKIMETAEFDVTVKVTDNICHNRVGTVKKEIALNAVGLNEAVTVDLYINCGCECEDPSRLIVNSPKCTSGNGTSECGICRCNSGRFGRFCECDESEISKQTSVESCKAGGNDSLICSGNGDCICGTCECLPIQGDLAHLHTGVFCECNNFNCPSGKNKLLCGGASRGYCTCGVCECLPGWTGRNCDCTTSEETCLASDGKMCNGVGTCLCGKCACKATSNMMGPTCEDCPFCPSQCSQYVDCAQCRGFQSGLYGEKECEKNCHLYTINKEETLQPSKDGMRACEGTDVDKCTFYFTYEYGSGNDVIITIQETKSCPKEVPVVAIVAGTISAVVLIPLILLGIFLFLRNLKDKEEYAKFTSDREKSRWDTGANPLYKGPTTTFQNPDYKSELDPSGSKTENSKL